MTLRDDLLPVFNGARQLIQDLGLRQTRVIRRIRTWSAGEVGLGALTVSDFEFTPRPKVENRGNGIVLVSKVTPDYSGGGYTLDEIRPTLTAGQDLIYILIGPDGGEHPYQLVEVNPRKNFGYSFELLDLDRTQPDIG